MQQNDKRETQARIYLLEEEIDALRKERDELMDILNQPMDIPDLDRGELEEWEERVRRITQELNGVQSELSERESLYAQLEEEYKRIKVTKRVRYEIYEVGKEDEEEGRSKVISPQKRAGAPVRTKSSTIGSPNSFARTSY